MPVEVHNRIFNRLFSTAEVCRLNNVCFVKHPRGKRKREIVKERAKRFLDKQMKVEKFAKVLDSTIEDILVLKIRFR